MPGLRSVPGQVQPEDAAAAVQATLGGVADPQPPGHPVTVVVDESFASSVRGDAHLDAPFANLLIWETVKRLLGSTTV